MEDGKLLCSQLAITSRLQMPEDSRWIILSSANGQQTRRHHVKIDICLLQVHACNWEVSSLAKPAGVGYYAIHTQ